VKRIRIWLKDQDMRAAKEYDDGKPHYRAYGNQPTDHYFNGKVRVAESGELFPPGNEAKDPSR
jgi:hypothetical protein